MGKAALTRWEITGLVLVLLGAGFFRLYKITDYMTFLGDEGRDVLAVRAIVLGQHLPLVGPGTSIGNMYLGPLYYYLIAPSLLLANFSPVGPAAFVAIIGVATVGLLWFLGRSWFGPLSALSISALYALSPVVIIYSRSSWNPNIMPFFALLAMIGIWQVWRFARWPWLIVTAVSLAFVLNSHYLGLLLFPPIFVFWWLPRKLPAAKRYTLVSVLLFLLLLSPLLWFDLRHGWNNFSAMKQFFTDRQTTVNFKAYKALPNLWPIWTDINITLLTAGNKALGSIVSVVVLLTLTLTLTKNRKLSPELILVATWLGIGLVGLGLYKQHIYAHYFGFLFPVPFLLLGFVTKLAGYPLRLVGLVGIFFLLLFNLLNNPLRTGPNYQLARTQTVAQFIDRQASGRPFNLALVAKTNYDAGYRYFLELQNSPYRTIHQQLTDQLFVICEIPDCQPVGHPLWEIAAFGWAKIDRSWDFPWGVKVYRLVHNPTGT